MKKESKDLSTAENLSVDLDAEFRKSVAWIKLQVHLVLEKKLKIHQLHCKGFNKTKQSKAPSSAGIN